MNLLCEPRSEAGGSQPLVFAAWQESSVGRGRESAESAEVQALEFTEARNKAVDAAYEEGRADAAAEFALGMDAMRLEERRLVADAVAAFARERVGYFATVEGEVVRLALSIARRVLQREVKLDPVLLAGVVRVALSRLTEDDATVLRVAAGDAEIWEAALRDVRGLVVVATEGVERGECRLEAAGSVAELGVEAQLTEIERGFFDLLARRPA